VGAMLIHAERTDRLDEANSGFSQFCERAWKSTDSTALNKNRHLNLLAPEFFFLILAHPVYEM